MDILILGGEYQYSLKRTSFKSEENHCFYIDLYEKTVYNENC